MIKRITTNIPIALTALVAAGFIAAPFVGADEVTVTETATVRLCGPLFSIDSNADKMTAVQRVKIIQGNLDRALIETTLTQRAPSFVAVKMKNRNPVVELDAHHIATADGNSAKRAGMSQIELAEKWADSIKKCLADSKAVETYISSLRLETGPSKVLVEMDKHISVVPPETKLPIKMASRFYFDGATLGDNVSAVLSRDVPLGPQFKTYLPAGTIAHGKVVPASLYTFNGFPNKNAVTIDFHALETPDGQEIPIHGFVVGGVNKFFRADALMADTQCAIIAPAGATVAAKGLITGAWVQPGMERDLQARMPRLTMDRGSSFEILPGEELQLETAATTSIAIAAPLTL